MKQSDAKQAEQHINLDMAAMGGTTEIEHRLESLLIII